MPWLVSSLRIEIAPYGLIVTMIYPDFLATEVRAKAFGADGQLLGQSPVREKGVMPVEKCVQLILKAMVQRRRELVTTLHGQVGQWLKLIAPEVVVRIALHAIKKGR